MPLVKFEVDTTLLGKYLLKQGAIYDLPDGLAKKYADLQGVGKRIAKGDIGSDKILPDPRTVAGSEEANPEPLPFSTQTTNGGISDGAPKAVAPVEEASEEECKDEAPSLDDLDLDDSDEEDDDSGFLEFKS